MSCRAHRTHQLTGSVFAVHARNRLEIGLERIGVLRIPRVIAVDAEPVHFAATGHFGFADYWDVVFRLAGDHARAAADAASQIDDHAPLTSGGGFLVRIDCH